MDVCMYVCINEHVRLLGVIISSDFSLQKHVATVCFQCFYWLRHELIVRRSLDTESATTLTHAFVTAPSNATDNVS